MKLEIGGPLVLVGAGKMGGALLAGWLGEGLDPGSVFIQDPAPSEEISGLAKEQGVHLNAGGDALPGPPAVMVLAVKPQVMNEVLPPLGPLVGANTVVLSIAAGITISGMEKHLGGEAAIVRSMPNTPAAIGRGISVACANGNVTTDQKTHCDALLHAIGAVAWTEDEAMLDSVTAVSGSGPAYVFLLAECLEQAGIDAGLPHDLAKQLAQATVTGAGELLKRSELKPADLRKNVTSPGGTTAAALDVLMGEDAFKELLSQAVAAAAKRSRELSS